jgi:adenylate cyclase
VSATFHSEVLRWMHSAQTGGQRDITTLVHGYSRLLSQHGIALYRVNMPLTTLHPQFQALRYVWYDEICDPGPFPAPTLFHRAIHHIDGCTIDEAFMIHGARDTPQYVNSPWHRLAQSRAARLSFPIAAGETQEFPIFRELAGTGATHYLLARIAAGNDGMISFVTRQPGGFRAEQQDLIESSLPALGALVDAAVKDLILETVLHCYVGYAPTDEIMRGNIRPGTMLDIDGAIWFSDIRKYSTHTQSTTPAALIAELNTYYECVVPIIYEHGGEVLKFIGDAILAIFPTGTGRTRESVCRDAYAAATAANRMLADRAVAFRHGIGLHVGAFQYGNIGSLRRMDFTVIGNEVNIASRVEGQCSVQQQALLMSTAFVNASGIAARAIARTALKGIAGDAELFVPVSADEKAAVPGHVDS